MHNIKLSTLVSAVVSFLLGIMFLVINPGSLMHIILIILGIFIILANILDVIVGFLNYKMCDKTKFYPALISTIIGVLLLFWQNGILNICVAVWFIIIPILRIIRANDKKAQFKKEVIYLIIGAILLVFGPWSLFDVVFKIFGVILIIYAVLLLVLSLKSNNKKGNKKNDNIIDAEIIREKDR